MKKNILLLAALMGIIRANAQCTTTVAAISSFGGPATYVNGPGGFQGPFRLCNNAVVYDTSGTNSRNYYVTTGSTLYLKNSFFHTVWVQAGGSLVNLGGIGDIYVYKDAAASTTGNYNQSPTVCTTPSLSFPNPTTCPAPTSIQQHQNENLALDVFPNPTSGNFFINTGLRGEITAEVLDLSGRILISRMISGSLNEIRTEGLEPGIYYVRARSGEGTRMKRVTIVR